jgi:CRP/FNR family transcriptional regulator
MFPLSHREIDAFKSLPMFSALGETTLRELAANCEVRTFPAGTMVFCQRQPARRFHVVLSGRVKVFKLSSRGDEQILHIFGAGETFGEAAMWAGDKYPACAQALEDAELLGITRQGILRAIKRDGELAMRMLAGMSAKLREFARLIEELSLKEVPARLARVLLEESRAAGSSILRLRQTKRELAAQIGTVPATLSRALGKLRNDGIIEVRGPRIIIRNLRSLMDLSENG